MRNVIKGGFVDHKWFGFSATVAKADWISECNVSVLTNCLHCWWDFTPVRLRWVSGHIVKGGWGCEVSCGGHRWRRGKTTMGFSSRWFHSNTGLSSTQYEQIPIIFGNLAIWADSLLFSCDQAALWMVFSVCPSVCLSVCLSVRHTFLTMFPSSYHHEIFRSYHHGPG